MIVALNGIELHYEIVGEGEPLLWLHGFLGCGDDWRHVFASPPAGFRLIAPDLRGHGKSTNPSGVFSFRNAAEDIRALIRHLGLTRVKAIGLSGGGIVLLHIATTDAMAIHSMVIVSAPPYFPEQVRTAQRKLSETVLGETAMSQMRRSHARGDAQIRELFSYSRAMAEHDDDVNFTPACLATIEARTLIVFGDNDPFYPVSLATELHSAIPRSRLWVVPGGGHGPIFGDHAPRFVEVAVRFLSAETPSDE
jgi:pimeloyl-ACP methyl ester carboxylesterase